MKIELYKLKEKFDMEETPNWIKEYDAVTLMKDRAGLSLQSETFLKPKKLYSKLKSVHHKTI
jgi:hypothetical protein